MNASALPTRRVSLLEENAVLQHRSLFCPEYDGCLAIASAGAWMSWSCEKCPLARARTGSGARLLEVRAA